MKLQQLVTALDVQIAQGDILGAFQKYAADHCVTSSNDHDKTQSKAQKLEALRWFFDNVATTNRIEVLATKVGDNVTESQFAFDFTNRQGEPLRFNEVIRRTWKQDLVVEETYLVGATLDQPAAKTKTAAKEPAAAAPKKAGKPKADKKPAATSAKAKQPSEVKAGK